MAMNCPMPWNSSAERTPCSTAIQTALTRLNPAPPPTQSLPLTSKLNTTSARKTQPSAPEVLSASSHSRVRIWSALGQTLPQHWSPMTGGAPKPRAQPVETTFSASSSSLKIQFPPLKCPPACSWQPTGPPHRPLPHDRGKRNSRSKAWILSSGSVLMTSDFVSHPLRAMRTPCHRKPRSSVL